jgi:HEAT repeat protein
MAVSPGSLKGRLLVVAAFVVFAGGGLATWIFLQVEPLLELEPAAVRESHLTLQASPSGELPSAIPFEATTPQEVRDILKFTGSAGQDDLPELRRLALESKDPLVAGNAIRALGRLKALVDDERLIKLLADDRDRVCQEMVMALGASESVQAVKPLAAVMEKRDPDLRALAIQSLGRLNLPEAGAVLEKLRNDPLATPVDLAFARAALKPRSIVRRVQLERR